uniref:Uncharacterized protein n=1 Tax=Ditylenchus dipsaci TaxID=166011 RepID=A0A915EAV6_9BILA
MPFSTDKREYKYEWFSVGVGCFKELDKELRMTWTEANIFCKQPENNVSQLFELQDWFLHYQLSQQLSQQSITKDSSTANPLRVTEFWTGWRVQVVKQGELPRHLVSSSNSELQPIVYNPLWSSLEPQLFNATEGWWCISWIADFQSPAEYGWKIRPCSLQLPVICQTFACYAESDGLPQYRCADNNKCIARTSLCDNVQDCSDNDDEMPPNCVLECQQESTELKSSHGNIFTPGFVANTDQSNITSDAVCEWTIKQDPGVRIKLNFMAVDIDSKDDELLVEGLDSGEKFPIALYNQPMSFISSGSKLRIKYKSGKSYRTTGKNSGFHLQYSTEESSNCVRKFESATDCFWTIDNYAEEVISIRIPYFRLAIGDWLAIFDGDLQEQNLFGNFTASDMPPMAFLSHAKEINFKFWAGPDTPGEQGFEVNFERSCKDQFINSSFGVIESLNYRFMSVRNASEYKCSWLINVPCSNCVFTIFFDFLDLLNVDEITLQEIDKDVTAIRSSIGMPQFSYRSNTSSVVLSLNSVSNKFFTKISFSVDCPKLSDVLPRHLMLLPSISFDTNLPYRTRLDLGCGPNIASSVPLMPIVCGDAGQWDTKSLSFAAKSTKTTPETVLCHLFQMDLSPN